MNTVPRLLLFSLPALLAATLACAQTPAVPADWPGLKSAAVDLHAQVQDWQARQSGEIAHLALYLGAPGVEATLRHVEVIVDRLPALRYQFSEVEAAALREGQRQRLQLDRLPAGRHHLRVQFVAREPGSIERMPSVDARLEQDIEIGAGNTALEVLLAKAGTLSRPALQLRALSDDAGLADARTRYAALLQTGGRSFAAATELRLLQMQMPAPALPAAFASVSATVSAELGFASDDTADAGGAKALLARYNRAVDALAGGDNAAALQALDQLGQEKVQSTLALAVRDQANLALGYQRLRELHGAEAIPAFQRIRSPGPCDNAALLGLGWAYLLPTAPAGGDRQNVSYSPPALRPGDADAVAAARRLTPFRYRQAVAQDDRALDIRRALVPWEELIGRDPLDPAVQEGMLVVPYALDHIGAHQQAIAFYQRAVTQLDAARATLDAAAAQIDSGELLALLDARDADTGSGWPRLLVGMRDDREIVPLRRLSRDQAVADALQAHRQSSALRAALAADAGLLQERDDAPAAALRARLDGLRARLEALAATQDAAFVAAAKAALRRIGEQTEHYLVEAYFALARANDVLPHAPADGGAR